MASTSESKNNGGKGKAGNTSLEPCETRCVPEFQKNENPNIKKQCDPSLLTDDLCFLEKDAEKIFYDAIDWKILKENINTYMGYFIEELNQNEKLGRLIQQVYKFGPIPNEVGVTVRRFARLGFQIIANDNFRFCDNIVVNINLNTGKRTQAIAHISLHPKLPVYYREKLRKRSGCGYYQRSATGVESKEVEELFGPFHYVIDTLYWKNPVFPSTSKDVPFTRFNPDPRKPGLFLNSVKNFTENIARHPIDSESFERSLPMDIVLKLKEKAKEKAAEFFLGQPKPPQALYRKTLKDFYKELEQEELATGTLDPEKKGSGLMDVETHKEALKIVHTSIASNFIDFWNTKMTQGFEEPPEENREGYTGFPPILKEAVAANSSKGGPGMAKDPTALKDENVVMDLSRICRYKHVYSGLFLQNEVANKLLAIANDVVPSEFKLNETSKVHCGHVTMGFAETATDAFFNIKDKFYKNPVPLIIKEIVFGKIDGKVFVTSQVELPESIVEFSKNRFPHITVYHDPSLKPEMSTDLLEDKETVTEKGSITLGMEVPTFLGIFTGKNNPMKGGTRKVMKQTNKTRRLVANKH